MEKIRSEWRELSCGDEDSRVITEGMNVSGGCLVRTIVSGAPGTNGFTGVAQTFLPNMHVEEIRQSGKFECILTSGKEIF